MPLSTLAQLPAAPAVDSLPSPSPISHFLLENPYPLAILLVLAAAVVMYTFNRRAQARRGVRIGFLLAAIAAAIVALGHFVQTTREKLILNTALLVDATAVADTGRLGPMLAPDCSLMLYGRQRTPLGKDEILSKVQEYPGRQFPVKDHSIVESQAIADSGRAGRTQVRVRVTPNGMPPIGSWWRIAWRRDADTADDPLGGWRVVSIGCLSIDGVPDLGAQAP